MMNKHCPGKALIVVFLLAGIALAQESKTTRVDPAASDVETQNKTAESEAVFDDDGGRVFVLRRHAGPMTNLRHYGGGVIAEPEQHSVFLGAGWSEEKRRASETMLTNLLGSLNQADERAALARSGVRQLFAASFTHEAPVELADNTVSDRQVRVEIMKMFAAGTLPAPSTNAVYVVYLAPGLQSTLGTLLGGKHYLAYHNYFNTESGEIRYVVVPYEANPQSLRRVAQRALVEAVINPSGTGWY